MTDAEIPFDFPPNPRPEELLEIVTEAFKRLGDDPNYLSVVQVAVPGGEETYGVRVPELRKLTKSVLKAYRQDSVFLQSLALESWERQSREHRLFAIFLLAGIKDLSPAERWSLGERFLPDVGDWEICDQLCHALLGEALAKDAQYMDVLEIWQKAPNFWVRRAALVAPVFLRRAQFSEELALELDSRTLAMCTALLEDREKYIRKAVDWSIRSVLQRNYDLGREWLMARASEKPTGVAKSTLKLAAKKLTEADKDEFAAVFESR
jgi:3-methyladenine DNA glycosylase AlkD